MARARQRALTSISLSCSRAGLEWSSRFFVNAFLSFAPFFYTRALESLTAVVPRLDRGSASVHTRRYRSQNANTIYLVSDLYCMSIRSLALPLERMKNAFVATIYVIGPRKLLDLRVASVSPLFSTHSILCVCSM